MFGVNDSPFLLAAILESYLKRVPDADKGAAKILWKSIYVDNCVASVNSTGEYEAFREISTRVLSEAKMELRCWEHGPSPPPTEIQDFKMRVFPVLGLKWDRVNDTLAIELELPKIPEKTTKRSILLAVHKVYDPIGFISPVMLQPKLLLQDIWAQDVTWDEEVSEEIAIRFQKWANELILLKDVRIPRHFNP